MNARFGLPVGTPCTYGAGHPSTGPIGEKTRSASTLEGRETATARSSVYEPATADVNSARARPRTREHS